MEDDYVYFVYLTTNKINGKQYIGQHRCKRSKMFTDGYLGSGVILTRAIKKYERENFERIILEYANSPDELNALEAKYANETILDNDNFYNLRTGGNQSVIYSEETKAKIKANHARPMLGKHFSKEHNQKISAARKGKIFSEEWKQHISQNHADINGEKIHFIISIIQKKLKRNCLCYIKGNQVLLEKRMECLESIFLKKQEKRFQKLIKIKLFQKKQGRR